MDANSLAQEAKNFTREGQYIAEQKLYDLLINVWRIAYAAGYKAGSHEEAEFHIKTNHEMGR